MHAHARRRTHARTHASVRAHTQCERVHAQSDTCTHPDTHMHACTRYLQACAACPRSVRAPRTRVPAPAASPADIAPHSVAAHSLTHTHTHTHTHILQRLARGIATAHLSVCARADTSCSRASYLNLNGTFSGPSFAMSSPARTMTLRAVVSRNSPTSPFADAFAPAAVRKPFFRLGAAAGVAGGGAASSPVEIRAAIAHPIPASMAHSAVSSSNFPCGVCGGE